SATAQEIAATERLAPATAPSTWSATPTLRWRTASWWSRCSAPTGPAVGADRPQPPGRRNRATGRPAHRVGVSPLAHSTAKEPEHEAQHDADQERGGKRNVDPRALALDDDVTRQAAEPKSLAQQPDEPDGDQDQAYDDQHLRHLRYLMRIAGWPAAAP